MIWFGCVLVRLLLLLGLRSVFVLLRCVVWLCCWCVVLFGVWCDCCGCCGVSCCFVGGCVCGLSWRVLLLVVVKWLRCDVLCLLSDVDVCCFDVRVVWWG